jgi:hypothetical protein
MSGLAGLRDFIVESQLLDSTILTKALYFEAESRGMGKATPAARDWVIAQWREIAAGPYKSEAFRTVVYFNLRLAAAVAPAARTPAQAALVKAFEDYINVRRVYLAQLGLAMYDGWKAYDDKAKASVKRSSLAMMFDYGTVPLDFHGTLGATMVLGTTGAGLGGAIAAANGIANQMKWVQNTINLPGGVTKTVWVEEAGSGLFGLFKSGQAVGVKDALQPLNLLKGTAVANAALAGATIIQAAFAIIQSIAMDQFIAIISARPKLEAALAQARQPLTLAQLLAQPNGSDQAVYFWAKALEAAEFEDAQLVALAATAQQQAQAQGYQLQVASAQ